MNHDNITAVQTEKAELRMIAADLTRASELRARRGDRRAAENLRHAAHLVASVTERDQL